MAPSPTSRRHGRRDRYLRLRRLWHDQTHTGSSTNYWLFTGEQADRATGDTGYYFLRARYYDSALGRFISRDPLLFDQRYVYAGNNPVLLVDPSGLCGWSEPWNCPDNVGGAIVDGAQAVASAIGDANQRSYELDAAYVAGILELAEAVPGWTAAHECEYTSSLSGRRCSIGGECRGSRRSGGYRSASWTKALYLQRGGAAAGVAVDIVVQVAVINGGLAVMQNFENIAIACAPVVLELVS